MDDLLIEDMKKKKVHLKDIPLLPEGKGWLIVEFGGESKEEADEKANKLMEDLNNKPNPPSMTLYDQPNRKKLMDCSGIRLRCNRKSTQ